MKTNESIGSDLKAKISDEMANSGVMSTGIEGVLASNEFKRDIPENKGNKKTKIIKKPMSKVVTNKLVGNSKINKPVSKLTSGLPIMGENKSAKSQFKKDIQTDTDFKKFKEKDNEFGTPNVTVSDPFIKKNRYKRVGKEESKESTGSGSAGGFEAPLFSETKQEMQEKCWTGFEQKGMKKKGNRMVPNCVREGDEDDIKKVEATEATGSGSSGSFETNSAWAKSTNKKDWRGKSKTQIPGGKFVQVKKKCKKFPYCNQGDIKNLKIFENEKIKTAIGNISKRHNISENVIKTIIAYEYENTFSK
jgi:ribosome assembly protein YihI (activator of Der GTPase)